MEDEPIKVPEVNGFRYVSKYIEEPPSLELLEIFEGYEIYSAGRNPLVRVIKDIENGIFYSFENDGLSTNLNTDIKVVVRAFFQKD